MKKFIAFATLFFAFTVAASAQDKQMINSEEAAKLDAFKVSEALELKGVQQDEFISLFVQRYQVLNDPSMSEKRKEIMNKNVAEKVRASLTPEQLKKLDASLDLAAKVNGTAAPATAEKKAKGKK